MIFNKITILILLSFQVIALFICYKLRHENGKLTVRNLKLKTFLENQIKVLENHNNAIKTQQLVIEKLRNVKNTNNIYDNIERMRRKEL